LSSHQPGGAAAASVAEPAVETVERWRAETPGCAERIHLNNAGAALAPEPVLAAVRGHLEREARIGAYEAAEEAEERLAAVYESLARLLGARAGNVAVVENATVAVALALSAFDLGPGDRIVTSRSDYPSNQIMYLSLGRRRGVETLTAEDLPEGGVDPESVRALLARPGCRLVAISWVPTNSGLVQRVHEVGEICAEAGVPFLVDACQSVGQLPVEVERLRCDFLAGTARKFLRGPRGIGFLYVSDAALARGCHPLYVDMRGADWTAPGRFRLAPGARRFENWEFPYALVLGMGAAADYAAAAGPAALARTRELADTLRARLSALPWARVLDRGAERCAIVTAEVRGWDADELKLRLRAQGINTSASQRKDGVLDMDDKRAASVLRLSPHYYNTRQEIDAALAALAELASS
jgi:selenocysteine lyase/cysteine desulfurase